MNKPISMALLAVGILLVIFGVNSDHSFSSSLSRLFTGSPTDKAIWLLLAGIVCGTAGLAGLLRAPAK